MDDHLRDATKKVDFISRDDFAKHLDDIQYGEAPTGRTGENIDYQKGVYAGFDMAYVALKRFPAADVRPVVLCKDCQYYAEGFCYNPNSYDDDKSRGNTSPEWFCADGKLSKNYNCGADMREVPNGSP